MARKPLTDAIMDEHNAQNEYLAEIEKHCAALEQQQHLQTTLLQVILGQTSFETALFQMIKAVCQHIGWDWGELWSIDSGKKSLVHMVHWHNVSPSSGEFEEISKRITFTPGVGLPGRVWASLQPLWIPDVIEDGNFLRASFAKKDGLHSGFGIPIQTNGTLLGVMSFFSRNIQDTDRHLLEMLLAIGQQLGMFIERRRSEVAEQANLVTQGQQQRLIHHLRAITDQTLFPASILSELLPYMWNSDFNRMWDSLSELQQFTRRALHQTHHLLAELGAEHSTEVTAAALLDQLITKFRAQSRLEISLNAKGDCALTVDVQIALYCIAQEALQNVIQHARATNVTISLFAYPETTVLRIIDNGRGFNPSIVLQDRLGFRIMRECAEKFGAALDITSKINEGTQIELNWPTAEQRLISSAN